MEEQAVEVEPKDEVNYVCKCLLDDNDSSEKTEIPARKQFILSTVARTENYLRERRVPELIRFLFTKIIAEASEKPVAFLEELLDTCMLFRAGHGSAPVLFEKRHLEEIIKSFDPGNRGWLTIGQVRRIYSTIGLNLESLDDTYEERYPCAVILEKIKSAQEMELLDLLSSGMQSSFLDDHRSNKSDIS